MARVAHCSQENEVFSSSGLSEVFLEVIFLHGDCSGTGCCLSSAFSPHESVTAQGHLFKEMWRILASQDPPLCLPCQAASDMWCLATVRRQNGNGSLCTSDLRTVGCSVVLLQLCQNARTFHLHFEESAKTRARNKHQEYW